MSLEPTRHTLTDLLRRTGEVLSEIDQRDARLRRRDDDDLLLTTAERADAVMEALETLGRLARVSARDDAELQRGLGHAAPWTAYLWPADRLGFLQDLATAAASCRAVGSFAPVVNALRRWHARAGDQVRGDDPLRPRMRPPPAIPDDVDDPGIEKARGVVTLPIHVRWSGPPVSYDLDDEADLRRVYEQVMAEGNDDVVRHYIDVDSVIAQWYELFLPRHVQRAWSDWIRRRRGVDLPCFRISSSA